MAVEIVHFPNEHLVITRYSGNHSVSDSERVVNALETQTALAACYRFLIDLSAVETVEITPVKRPARVDRMLKAVKQNADKLILIAYYAPLGPGATLASSYQPQWNTQEGVISMASRELHDCATFLDVAATMISDKSAAGSSLNPCNDRAAAFSEPCP